MERKLANINYPEDLYKQILDSAEIFGRILDIKNDENYFSWCFCNIDISILEFCQSKDMYWNVLTMLNNCSHRLTISKLENNSTLIFEHPTVPEINQRGWMEKVKSQNGNLTDGFWGSST
jgi:nitrate reductase (NAD(P)H)